MAVTGVARLATSPSGACAALIGRWTRELCSEPTTMMLLFLAMWLGSNAYRAFSGPAHLQPGYMVPRAHSPAPNATGADVSGFALDADPSVLSTTFRVIQRGGYPVDGQYAESVTPNLRTCQQICASEPRCFMMSFNPSGYTTGGDVGRPYACARYDYSATEARMARGSHTTWRCVRERGKVPAVRRPPASERNKAVAVVYAGVHPHIAFVQRELLESQALLLNTLIREYEQVDVFFCVEPRHIPDVQDFRFTIEAGFERELVTTAAFGREGVKGMFGRLRGCWVDVAKYADTHNASYQWIVRTRPDIFFLGPLRPTLQLASQNAIHARGRRFGPRWDKIRGEEVSYWDYYDVCGGAIREKYACEWFDESHHADPSGDCMIIDDQFALIPPHLAPFYFGTTEGNHTHFSLPHTHLSCTKWAEGRLTCMVLRGGAQLELLYLPARLYKWCPDRCARTWGREPNCRDCRPGEVLCG